MPWFVFFVLWLDFSFSFVKVFSRKPSLTSSDHLSFNTILNKCKITPAIASLTL